MPNMILLGAEGEGTLAMPLAHRQCRIKTRALRAAAQGPCQLEGEAWTRNVLSDLCPQ